MVVRFVIDIDFDKFYCIGCYLLFNFEVIVIVIDKNFGILL